MNDPFRILGVDDTVNEDQLYDAYRKAREQWESSRFALGEEGMRACEKLDEIEEAYRDARDTLRDKRMDTTASEPIYAQQTDYGNVQTPEYTVIESVDLSRVDALIKEKRYEEAQAELDRIPVRSAEWHFLQSMIFYAKRWYGDVREQLRIAVQMEPENQKYKDALKNFESKMKGHIKDEREQSFYNTRDDRSYRQGNGAPVGGGFTPCDCCSSLICADCCCECMGGDLISCC